MLTEGGAKYRLELHDPFLAGLNYRVFNIFSSQQSIKQDLQLTSHPRLGGELPAPPGRPLHQYLEPNVALQAT